MKTIIYYHKNSDKKAYEKKICPDDCWIERTFDQKGNVLSFRNSVGRWSECTFDENNKILTYKDSDGVDRVY